MKIDWKNDWADLFLNCCLFLLFGAAVCVAVYTVTRVLAGPVMPQRSKVMCELAIDAQDWASRANMLPASISCRMSDQRCIVVSESSGRIVELDCAPLNCTMVGKSE